MRTGRVGSTFLLILLAVSSPTLAANGKGRIEGRVTHTDGGPMAHVTVTVNGTSLAGVSDRRGNFVLKRVPAGIYTLTFTFLDKIATQSEVIVVAGQTTRIDQVVDWDLSLIETVIVTSASRRKEPISKAPAAITRVDAEEIERKSADGQVPKLLEFTSGVEINQADLYNFNVNTRGFNRLFTHRTRVLVDGRDISGHAFGQQEWPAFSFALDDLESIEYLRGPSSAIYGANAANGVINLRTKAPRDDLGGRARVSIGELNTIHVDFRWSGALGNDWYVRATGGSRNSKSFLVSRAFSPEYAQFCDLPTVAENCVLQEVAPPLEEIRIGYGELRLDKYLPSGSLLTLEGGMADYEGVTRLSSAGRLFILDADVPWARVGYSNNHWELMGAFDEINIDAINLAGGTDAPVDTDRYQARVQTNWAFADEKVQFVAGGAYRSTDSRQFLDLATGKRGEVRDGYAFAQADWTVNNHLKLLGAASYDESSIHDWQISPKAGIVYSINPSNRLRFTYNQGIRAFTGFRYFGSFPLGSPLDLSSLQSSICDPAGVDCDLGDPVPFIGVGNNSLELEENVTYEIGYTGVIANRTILTLDVYTTEWDKFASGFLRQLGTPLGRLNDDFGPWEGPPDAEMTAIDPGDCPVPGFMGQTVADCVRAAQPGLSNTYDGDPIVPFVTPTNLGEARNWGVDLGVEHYLGEDWKFYFSYSWWGWEPQDEIAGQDTDRLFDPATPRHKASAGVAYTSERLDVSLYARWVDSFDVAAGVAATGPVESYTTAALTANYKIGSGWTVGTNISNVFDYEHYEYFGGSLIGRRALVYTTYSF